MDKNNVGKKIKNLIFVVMIIEIIACVITGIVVVCVATDIWWVGLSIAIAGSFFAWFSYILIYAYGELVDKACLIEEHLKKETSQKTNSCYSTEKVAGPNEWKCTQCGSINQNYVGTCGCGQSRK